MTGPTDHILEICSLLAERGLTTSAPVVVKGTSTAHVEVKGTGVLRAVDTGFSVITLSGMPADLSRHLVEELHLSDRRVTIVVLPGHAGKSAGGAGRRQAYATVALGSMTDGLTHEGLSYLKQVILDQVSPEVLSPYQSQRPVPDGMFFGRRTEVEDIADSGNNFVVYGPRRSGKTSLAHKVQRRILERASRVSHLSPNDGSAGWHRAIYLDLHALTDLGNIWYEVLRGLVQESDLKGGARRRIGLRRGEERSFTDYELLQHFLRTRHRHCLLLLDEVDVALAVDEAKGWPVFQGLRALADDREAQARIALFGYERLYRSAISQSFPLSGRSESTRIAQLDKEGVADLVEKPFKELGFALDEQAQLTSMIYRATGGMPNLVQDVCNELLRLDTTNRSRRVTLWNVAELLRVRRNALTRRIYMAFNELKNPLPRLIAYMTAERDEGVTVGSTLVALRANAGLGVRAPEVLEALNYLYLHNVFHASDQEGEYVFASELLRDRLRSELLDDGGTMLRQDLIIDVDTTPPAHS